MSEAASDKERSGQESVDGPAVRVVSGYCASRRTPRKHKRVVRQGTELFDADGVKLEPSDVLTDRQRAADDDKRILTELPSLGRLLRTRSLIPVVRPSRSGRARRGGRESKLPGDGNDGGILLYLQHGRRFIRRHGERRRGHAIGVFGGLADHHRP